MLDKEKERDIGSIYSLKRPLYNEHAYPLGQREENQAIMMYYDWNYYDIKKKKQEMTRFIKKKLEVIVF